MHANIYFFSLITLSLFLELKVNQSLYEILALKRPEKNFLRKYEISTCNLVYNKQLLRETHHYNVQSLLIFHYLIDQPSLYPYIDLHF